ncbi:unknown protein [Oryza sativa Japonica Group]|uniref:Uncharacterized protein n=1 Tax=Oryza sativa subsp. japonica TaxID=39947 RepID=Q5VRD2_ORYSJ|nr:unknown protein [Oryza sativa Japonica Group]BAD67991.1 unknown protein [Oryza sativa Japonica Group]
MAQMLSFYLQQFLTLMVVQDVCGNLPAPSSHEKLRGCQLSTKSRSMRHSRCP